jgi:hypothetical protein
MLLPTTNIWHSIFLFTYFLNSKKSVPEISILKEIMFYLKRFQNVSNNIGLECPKWIFLLFERSFELLEYNLKQWFVFKLAHLYKVAKFWTRDFQSGKATFIIFHFVRYFITFWDSKCPNLEKKFTKTTNQYNGVQSTNEI